MVLTKELKPPPELVEAIQASEDGSTAPAEADTGGDFSGDTPRTIRTKLQHETQQRPSKLRGDEEDRGVPHLSKEEKKAMYLEGQAMHNSAGNQYDRRHPGAGKAGRGDQQIDSKANICGNDRTRTRGPQHSYDSRHGEMRGQHKQ